MTDFTGKKLLILGGANQHLKYVETAKEMGIHTIVTDYLEPSDSPAKLISDEHWEIDINDIEAIVSKCRENGVDGVIAGHLDPCQMPYARICEALSLPCYGTVEQFHTMTDKTAFKAFCRETGVDVIDGYSIDDVSEGKVEYPIFIKPADSRGSRGQSVCNTKEEALAAIETARKESRNGEVIIECYMGDCDEFQVTCFVVNGNIYLERTVDSYRGSEENGLHRVVSCAVSPSMHTAEYLQNVHGSVCRMIEALGVKNGPVFMQGFCHKGRIHFFDPGLRFPGVEYERIVKNVTGVDFVGAMVHYALAACFPESFPKDEKVWNLNGKKAAVLFPALRQGVIAGIQNDDYFNNDNRCAAYTVRYRSGMEVKATGNVNQRYAEIDFVTDDIESLAETVEEFQENVRVLDGNGTNMLFDEFDTRLLRLYK